MVFSSMTFLTCALPLAVAVCFLLPARLRNGWLLLFSLAFYAWGEPAFLPLMLASVTLNYLAGLSFGRIRGRSGRRSVLAITVLANLGMLFWFKYAGFFAESANRLLKLGLPVPRVGLPIGISFYTFQAMSYTIDVYRKDAKPQRSWLKLALYISFFPQLIAGPIVRYTDVAARLDRRRVTVRGFARGLRRFAVGLGKKVLIANAVAALADEAFAAHGLSVGAAWLGAVAYALQIYYDFSGYSDMAIGLGVLFGFRYPENFNDPYTAVTIRDFWRRWHITLSSWFRDYLYIPLGGSRRGKARHILNLMLVFAVTGLWHGAGTTFLLWGLYHGALSALEALLPRNGQRNVVLRAARRALTLLLVLVGWVIFRADTVSAAGAYLRGMVTGGSRALHSLTPRAWLMLAVGVLGATGLPGRALRSLRPRTRERLSLAAAPALILLSLLSLASGAYNPFIYFRF